MAKGHRSQIKRERNRENRETRPSAKLSYARVSVQKACFVLDAIRGKDVTTAKAILVMGLLAMVNTGLSKQMLVLLYTFGDGYTNVIFPTSPVLLISLSMIEVDYFKWVKKSLPLFAVNLLLVLGFIALGVVLGY